MLPVHLSTLSNSARHRQDCSWASVFYIKSKVILVPGRSILQNYWGCHDWEQQWKIAQHCHEHISRWWSSLPKHALWTHGTQGSQGTTKRFRFNDTLCPQLASFAWPACVIGGYFALNAYTILKGKGYDETWFVFHPLLQTKNPFSDYDCMSLNQVRESICRWILPD